jgi:hypothetical protein
MTVNVGADLHKTQFTVCVPQKRGNGFEQHSTEEGGYQRFLKRVQRWQGAGKEVRIAVESTRSTRYFKNRTEAAGVGAVVINTLKVKADNPGTDGGTEKNQIYALLTGFKKKTVTWRLMQRYEVMKQNKGSGKSIIATARKLAAIIWHILSKDEEFNPLLMIDKRLIKKASSLREVAFQRI